MDLKARLDREYEELCRDVQRPNILIAGATGAGKSSLINLVFGEDLARTGTGRPVTKHLQRFESSSVPLVLFDTVGYEVDSDSHTETIDEITSFVAGQDQANAGEMVHLAWYVIDASRSRVLDIDCEFCQRIGREKLPVAVVLSKCDLVPKQDVHILRQIIRGEIKDIDVYSVTTKNLTSQGYLDLATLCEWSAEKLPSSLQYAFVKSQRISLKAKRKKAGQIISQHVIANAVTAATPIPFSDAPILIASQVAMLARILYVFELGDTLGALKSLYTLVGGRIVSQLGIKVAADLIKLFPGVGTIIGGMINACVASTITAAIGIAVRTVCEHSYELAISGRESELHNYLKNLDAVFREQLGSSYDIAKDLSNDDLEKELLT